MELKKRKYCNLQVLRPLGVAAATGLALCLTAAAASSSAEVDEAATAGVGRDRALNDGRENRSEFDKTNFQQLAHERFTDFAIECVAIGLTLRFSLS